MSKLKISMVIIIVVILSIAAAVGVHMSKTYSYEQLEKGARQYAKAFDYKIIEFKTKNAIYDKTVAAVTAVVKQGSDEKTACLYFDRDGIFKGRYTPAGIIDAEPGYIAAQREQIGEREYDIVFGIGLPDRHKSFKIAEMGIELNSTHENYLSIEYPSIGPFKVEYK